ncbi:MAG: hypothetical protein LBC84_03745, partial [Prevotellaceae bacterium]|nr:hypothetical protein [Prevotellaceae bacterium]
MKKFTFIIAALVLFGACSKEEPPSNFKEFQQETLVSHQNETFVSITQANNVANAFFGTLSD